MPWQFLLKLHLPRMFSSEQTVHFKRLHTLGTQRRDRAQRLIPPRFVYPT